MRICTLFLTALGLNVELWIEIERDASIITVHFITGCHSSDSLPEQGLMSYASFILRILSRMLPGFNTLKSAMNGPISH